MVFIILVKSQTVIEIDDYEKINSVNPLYLINGKEDGYIEENNGNKCFVSISIDGNKKF